jgi:transposase
MILPKPPTITAEEQHARQRAKLEEELFKTRQRNEFLEAEIARLREENERLTRQLAAARKTSATSSKPPSSDIVKPPKPPRKDGKKRQRGGQPGHEQHLRKPFPPEDVNRFVPYTLDCCPQCGGSLVPSRHEPKVLQQVEIQAAPIIITEHQGLAYWCPHCQKFHYAPFPTALEKAGLLGCDYFSAYRKYMRLNRNVLVQFCLAHFIRDVKFLVEHPDPQNRDYGCRVLALLKKLFATIHRREEYASEETFRRTLVRWRNALAWEVGMEAAETREAGNLANRFYRHFEEYFRFISEPGIDPTNNVAEQVQRFVAIHRRMTQGTRSERGRGWWERMCTAVATCDQQARSSFDFIFECVKAWIDGKPAPSLAPVPANSS